MKTCIKCGIEKEDHEFPKERNTCKVCKSEYNKQYCKEHKEERKQRKAQYYQDHREERLQYDKQYKKEHKEEIKQYRIQYYKQYKKEHKEEIKQYQKQYAKEHEENCRKYGKTSRENLSEDYLLKLLKVSSGLTRERIRELCPLQIEIKKLEIQIKREIKKRRKNNGNEQE